MKSRRNQRHSLIKLMQSPLDLCVSTKKKKIAIRKMHNALRLKIEYRNVMEAFIYGPIKNAPTNKFSIGILWQFICSEIYYPFYRWTEEKFYLLKFVYIVNTSPSKTIDIEWRNKIETKTCTTTSNATFKSANFQECTKTIFNYQRLRVHLYFPDERDFHNGIIFHGFRIWLWIRFF